MDGFRRALVNPDMKIKEKWPGPHIPAEATAHNPKGPDEASSPSEGPEQEVAQPSHFVAQTGV